MKSFFTIKTPLFLDMALVGRGLASVAVVWWHTRGWNANWSQLNGFNISGRYSVWIFFILSGYLMANGFKTGRYNFSKEKLKAFYWNRFLRIYPLFLFVSIISLLFHLFGQTFDFSPSNIFKNFLMLQWNHDYTLIGVFWTLGVEAQFYLVLPILLKAQQFALWKLKALQIYFLFLAAHFVVEKFHLSNSADYRSLIGNLVHFQAGIVINSLLPFLKKKDSTFLAFILGVIFIFMLYQANQIYGEDQLQFLSCKGILIADISGMSLLALHVLIEGKRIKAGFLSKILLSLGVLSYGLYAWHGFILRYFKVFSDSFIITFTISICLAFLSYKFIESPLLKRKYVIAGVK